MCGRFTLAAAPEELQAEFGIVEWPADLRPRYNIAPSQPVLAVAGTRAGARRAGWLTWGLPLQAANAPARKLINVRADTLARRGLLRTIFERHRCVLPADGFYEWKRTDGRSEPYHFHLPSARPFAIAAIWNHAQSHDAPADVALVTTDASAPVQPVHGRMPVILDAAGVRRWLDPDATPDELLALLTPRADLLAHPVSPLVNAPANDVPDCIVPLPPLPESAP